MLGNYIKLLNGIIKKVEIITGVAVGYWNNKNKDYFYQLNKSIHPIPITKEILEKCGFKLSSEKGDYVNEEIIFVYKEDNNWYLDTGIGGIKCNYLHQLQNAYFILTEKQLEVNL